jgi:hypothetical protein
VALPLFIFLQLFGFAAPRFSECGPTEENRRDLSKRAHAQEKRVRSLAAQNLWLHPRKIFGFRDHHEQSWSKPGL